MQQPLTPCNLVEKVAEQQQADWSGTTHAALKRPAHPCWFRQWTPVVLDKNTLPEAYWNTQGPAREGFHGLVFLISYGTASSRVWEHGKLSEGKYLSRAKTFSAAHLEVPACRNMDSLEHILPRNRRLLVAIGPIVSVGHRYAPAPSSQTDASSASRFASIRPWSVKRLLKRSHKQNEEQGNASVSRYCTFCQGTASGTA